MKILCGLFVLLVSINTYAEVVKLLNTRKQDDVSISSTRSSIDVSFHIAKLETDSENVFPYRGFSKLKFNTLKVDNSVGMPALPYHSIVVKGIPSDYRVNYQLNDGVVLNQVLLDPARSEKLRCGNCATRQTEVNWNSYYNKNSVYKIEYLGKFRGTDLTRISFFPSVYDGNKDELIIYPDANFGVSTDKTRINLDELVTPESIVTEVDMNNRYLIITPKKFRETLQLFVDWKEELGYDVSVFNLEDIGTTAESIKEFIHGYYNSPETKFTYALLVGHEESFPTFYLPTASNYRTPSDLSYFTFDGDSDFIPDVFYGRFVVDNVEELEHQIEKTIEYELAAYADGSGLSRSVGLASDEGSDPADTTYVRAMLDVFEEEFGMTPKYFMQANNNSTPKNVNEKLAEGVHWINYVGHGSGHSWASQWREYDVSEIAKVDSTGKVKPIIIDVACLNGNYTYGARKFGVEFMNATNNGNATGAVAYYGGSVEISWHPPAIMAIGINRTIAGRGVTHLGEALMAGHLYLSANHYKVAEIKENYTWFQLQGDPSLMLNF